MSPAEREAIAGPTFSPVEALYLLARSETCYRVKRVVNRAAGAYRTLELLYGVGLDDVLAVWQRFHPGGSRWEALAGWGALPALSLSRGDPRFAASAAKVGPGTRFGPAPDEYEWNAPLDRRKPDRLQRLERWELLGDHAVALYEMLAPRVPPARRRGGKFNRDVAALVAEIMNDHYAVSLSRSLTWEDVKSRLQARGRC